MDYTPEQRAVIEHPQGAHAVVRAVPGAGKTTTLVARVVHLCARGAEPSRIRVVMFNKAIQQTFEARLAAAGVRGVRVTTFDALGLEVLRAAERAGHLRLPLEVIPGGTAEWAQSVHRKHREAIDHADEIAEAVAFWKAHLVAHPRAAYPTEPALVTAYAELEALRLKDRVLRVAFEDMVFTAVGVLRQRPRLLGRIDHLLVDEFQDVNAGRVELMQRLLSPETCVMAVGDQDQGINEWCGAHPRHFRDFERSFPGLPTRRYPLTRSFRLGPRLAAAANALIRHNEDRDLAEVVGGGAAPGRVEVVEDVAATVRALLAGGRAPAELAILYRSRAQGIFALASLAAARVPMRTDDMSMLRQGRGPELALAYLRFASSDAPTTFEDAWPVVFAPDRFIRKEAFSGQMRQLGKRGLKSALANRKAARQHGQAPTGIDSMSELADLLQRMDRCDSAGAALDLLVREVDVPAQLCARIRSERDQELAIASFDAVHALLRGLEVAPRDAADALAGLDPQAGEAPEDCVWASTIHKAKGMEWPCVLLPGLAEGVCPAAERGAALGTVDEPEGVEQTAWIEQERRIFYVGLTRAIEAAYLQAAGDPPSRFVAEVMAAAQREPQPKPQPKRRREAG